MKIHIIILFFFFSVIFVFAQTPCNIPSGVNVGNQYLGNCVVINKNFTVDGELNMGTVTYNGGKIMAKSTKINGNSKLSGTLSIKEYVKPLQPALLYYNMRPSGGDCRNQILQNSSGITLNMGNFPHFGLFPRCSTSVNTMPCPNTTGFGTWYVNLGAGFVEYAGIINSTKLLPVQSGCSGQALITTGMSHVNSTSSGDGHVPSFEDAQCGSICNNSNWNNAKVYFQTADGSYIWPTVTFRISTNGNGCGGTGNKCSDFTSNSLLRIESQEETGNSARMESVEQNQPFQNVALYPNPTSGKITLELSEAATVVIYDIFGKQILLEELETGISTLAFTNHPSSLLIAHINYKSYKHEYIKIILEK